MFRYINPKCGRFLKLKAIIYVLVSLMTMLNLNSYNNFAQCANQEGGGGDGAKKYRPEPTPLQLTKETFSDHITKPKVGTFVKFYAPWCGHCKRMTSTWNELAERHNINGEFSIAKVDCTVDDELCSDQDVLGYPTFIYYKRNSVHGERYEGERKLEAMESFMITQSYLEDEKKDDDDGDEMEAKEINEVKFTVHNLNSDNFHSFVSRGYHFIKFFAPWCGHCQILAPTWEELASKYKKKRVKISKVDCTMHKSICQEFGVRGYPTLLLFYNGKKVEAYNDERSFAKFSEFLDNRVQEEADDEESAEADYQPPDESILVDVPGKVIEINGKNMHRALAKPGLLFVKFFAPWCGHCRSMAQTWIDLAKNYEKKESVSIAEVDCTNSQELCMNNNINGYPTLILFKDGKRLQQYEQERTLESFISFIEKGAHDEL